MIPKIQNKGVTRMGHVKNRRISSIWLVLLMITALFPVTARAAEVLTVTQAIAQQDGSIQTVRGYIIGTVKSQTSFTTEAPFANTNLVLADTPTETDQSKVLYIQLPVGAIRNNWNLLDHPDKKGSQVDITGSLTPYFTPHAGLKDPTSISLADGVTPVTMAPVSFQFKDDKGNTIHENVVKELPLGSQIEPSEHVIEIPDFEFYYGTSGVTVRETGTTVVMVYKSTKLYEIEPSTGTILKYNGSFPFASENYLDIPAVIEGVQIKHIARNAFYAKNIRYLTIPEGIETIGELAFAFNNIFAVTFPSTLREMGKSAFAAQYIKGDIDLSMTQLVRIEETAFSGTAGSTVGAIRLPETITFIGKQAFYNTEATTVNLPNSITTILDSAFAQNNLTKVVLPAELISLGQGAFANNDISSLTFNDKLTLIPAKAFEGNKLRQVRLPEIITEVGERAFAANPITYFEYWSGTTIGPDQFRWNNNPVTIVEMTHVIHQYVTIDGTILEERDIPQPVGTVINPAETALNFDGMELVEVPESYTIVTGANTVTYVYAPVKPQEGEVIFVYVDEIGTVLAAESHLFEVGTVVNPADYIKTFEGYELVSPPSAITVQEGSQFLEYTYKKIVVKDTVTVTLRLVDAAGNEIAQPLILEVNPGSRLHLKQLAPKWIGSYKLDTKYNWVTLGNEEQVFDIVYKLKGR